MESFGIKLFHFRETRGQSGNSSRVVQKIMNFAVRPGVQVPQKWGRVSRGNSSEIFGTIE